MRASTDFVPFALPSLGREEENAVLEVLHSGWLTTGKVAHAFEREFADFLGVSHALAVNSATSGLHLALEALGVGPGCIVVTSPYTFTSTAAVARHPRRRSSLLRRLARGLQHRSRGARDHPLEGAWD